MLGEVATVATADTEATSSYGPGGRVMIVGWPSAWSDRPSLEPDTF
jgi:hypothetical protein